MVIIEKNNMTLEVEVETTREYYKNRNALDGVINHNFTMQALEASPLLAEFLEEFGVDITKPDELCWCWKDGEGFLHYNVAYTITGNIIKAKQYEILLQDKTELHIVLEKLYIPNEQTEPYFGFTVYNIKMPWIMEEEYPDNKEMEKETKKESSQSFVELLRKKLKKH